MEKRGRVGIFPPQHNAVTSQERPANKKKASTKAVEKRNGVIKAVRSLGRKQWKEQTGYHRRSLAEPGIFWIKTILGRQLTSRLLENQITEHGDSLGHATYSNSLNFTSTPASGLPSSHLFNKAHKGER